MDMKKNKHNNSGQVLIVGIIMILIMLLAIFILFDVHNVIRAKIKVETAEQAAALAAARWQGESLNLIGDMNLLIANEIILASSLVAVPDDIYDVRDRATARIKSINELQTRVSFLGPLVGLFAAQQTAKNNGLSPRTDLHKDVSLYNTTIEEEIISENSKYPDKINGFLWKVPYKRMLRDIVQSGMAVRPSGNANGIENVIPRFLADPTFYDAVLNARLGGMAWCHYHLRSLVKKSDDYFIGKSWYMPDFLDIHRHFIKQSEIYSLYVNLDEAYESNQYYDEFVNLLNRPGIQFLAKYVANEEDKSNVLDQNVCRFFIYDDRYYPEKYSYNGPDVGVNSMWRGGLWLRKNLKENFVFGGAVAYAEGASSMGVVYKIKAPANSGKKKISKFAERTDDSSVSIGGEYGNVAKVFSSAYLPISIPIVAPVFDQVSLIPSTMHNVRPFTMEVPLVEKFIKYLAQYDVDIHNPFPDPPTGTAHMLQALQVMADPNFRKRGYNTEFSGLDNIAIGLLFGDSYKYPNRSDGAGWLQQACVRRMEEPPPGALTAEKENKFYYFNTQIAEELNKQLRKEYEDALKNMIPGKKPPKLIQYMV